MKDTETKPIQRFLPVELTREELLCKGKEQADLSKQLREFDAEKKRINDDFKAKLSEIDSKLIVLSNAISTGEEYRQVECTVTFSTPTKTKKTVTRDDTGAQVSVEDMTKDEMQRELIEEDKTESGKY